MQEAFERLLGLIDIATSRVGTEYFQLPRADADAVYRERVYCYELYHQLRHLWDDFPFSLAGEVDKEGNPHFRNGPYARVKPDLLIHVPGDMDDNLAVVEVKSANGLGGTRGDLQKLSWFCENARYFRGIFLVYGEAGDTDQLAHRVRRAAEPGIDLERLVCLYHRRIAEGTAHVLL